MSPMEQGKSRVLDREDPTGTGLKEVQFQGLDGLRNPLHSLVREAEPGRPRQR